MKNYYEILGVSISATHSEIRMAYRKLAQQFHPDVNPDPQALEKIKEINDAYDTLSDSKKRSLYDQRLVNPSANIEPPPPKHRDPAYKRRYKKPESSETYSAYELMAMYLKYIRWISAGSFIYVVLLGIDFIVPRKEVIEPIKETRRVYNISRYGNSAYSHDVMVMGSGKEVKLYEYSVKVFLNESDAIIKYTPLFKHVMSAAVVSTGEVVKAGNAYSALWFVPALLFICSGLGLFLKGVEMPFNLGIISAVLFLVTLYLF